MKLKEAKEYFNNTTGPDKVFNFIETHSDEVFTAREIEKRTGIRDAKDKLHRLIRKERIDKIIRKHNCTLWGNKKTITRFKKEIGWISN